MKTKLTILLVSVLLLIISISFSKIDIFEPITVFKKGTKIGTLSVSNIPLSMGESILTSKLNNPIYLNLTNKSRGVTPKNMGYSIDRDKLTKLTKTCKSKVFRLICINTSNENIDPNSIININEDKLNTFITDLESEVQYLSENNIISFVDYSFRAVSPNTKITLKKDIFKNKDEIAGMITKDNVKIKLNYKTSDNLDAQNKQTQKLIDNMTYPLLIKYGGTPISVPQKTLKSFITTEKKENLMYGKILTEPIREYLNRLGENHASEDVVIVKEASIEAIKRALLFRASNYEINEAVILPLEGKPKTNGELHNTYLEVIKSQQRLYKFENGKLTKKYIISTGLTWDTPPGVYEVLGKQKMTISYFGNWYMPNYLPIGTINGYKFGFHAIPYHMDAGGNIYSRDSNTMGSPATGGCIQLTQKESLELFKWADIGTPVYIYE